MKKGFTLIELLIVIAVLGILTVTVISTINPIEQINRGKDTGSLSDAEQLLNAIERSYTTSGYYPWKVSPINPLPDATAWGPVVNTVPGWDDGTTAVLTKLSSAGTGEVKTSFISRITSANYNTMYKYNRGQSGDSTYICFLPKSEDFKTKAVSGCGTNGSGLPDDLKPLARIVCEGGPGNVFYYCLPNAYSQTAQSTTAQTTSSQQTQIPSPSPTNNVCIPWSPGKYALDDTKFLRTYAVLFFSDPGIDTNNMVVDVSFRPDFGGTVGGQVNNPYTNYVPDTADTILQMVYTTNAQLVGQNISSIAYRKLTNKYSAYISQPYLWKTYLGGCGKNIYWRVKEFFNKSKMSPVYTGVVDCDSKVGVIDPGTSWYSVYDVVALKQKKYDSKWDLDCNGVIDWTDYWIAAFSTKARSGGWASPE